MCACACWPACVRARPPTPDADAHAPWRVLRPIPRQPFVQLTDAILANVTFKANAVSKEIVLLTQIANCYFLGQDYLAMKNSFCVSLT